MIRRPPRSTQSRSSAASDVYKRQMKIIPDADVTYASVKNGELDFGRYTLTMKQSLQLEKEHSDIFTVYYVQNIAPDLIFTNFRDPDNLSKTNFYFGDIRVRQALLLSLIHI